MNSIDKLKLFQVDSSENKSDYKDCIIQRDSNMYNRWSHYI